MANVGLYFIYFLFLSNFWGAVHDYQKTELKGTQGCIRISDEDIKTLKEITDYIEERDPEEKGETLILEDDLETQVKYEDRNWLSDIYNFRIYLDELIVYPDE